MFPPKKKKKKESLVDSHLTHFFFRIVR